MTKWQGGHFVSGKKDRGKKAEANDLSNGLITTQIGQLGTEVFF